MTTATQTADRPMGRSTDGPMRDPLPAHLLRALHAEWRKLSPNLAVEPGEGETPARAERRVRIEWSRRVLHAKRLDKGVRDIESWNDLKPGEAKFLLKKMRDESGSNSAYRAMLIAQLAVELFGPDWNEVLRERLVQRFRTPNPQSLNPTEAHEMIEELLSRLARRDGVGIEEVRARFGRKKAEASPVPDGTGIRS